MNRIILASKSPRRKELLTQLGLSFDILVSNEPETITKENPCEIVEELSWQKATNIWKQLEEMGENKDEHLIIAADTIVVKENHILGKPKNENDAITMLNLLQGDTHQVYTGVTLLWNKAGEVFKKSFQVRTDVTVYPMSEEEIQNYVNTKDPLDKAGAYGIQGCFAAYINSVAGEYNNVVGLPIGRLYQVMKENSLLD